MYLNLTSFLNSYQNLPSFQICPFLISYFHFQRGFCSFDSMLKRKHLIAFALLTLSPFSFSQSGIQPWKKPFIASEKMEVKDDFLHYENKKGKSKKIALSRIEKYQIGTQTYYPNDYAFFLNGKLKKGQFAGTDDSLKFAFKRPSGKIKKWDRGRIFSYRKNGKEQIVFRTYITAEDSLSVEAARAYAEGGLDATRYYRKPYGAIANFFVGAAGGYFLGPYGIIAPGVYTGVEGAIPLYLKGKKIEAYTKGRLQTDSYYRQGFINKVKKRKALMSGLGGLSGFIVGFGALEYMKAK